MKVIKWLTFIFLLLIGGYAIAVPSSPAELYQSMAIFFTNNVTGRAEIVTSANPLPVIGTFTTTIADVALATGDSFIGQVTATGPLPAGTNALGSVTIIIPSTSSQTVILLTSTDYVIVPIANRRYVHLAATGTFEFAVGVTVVPTNTTPCYNASLEEDSSTLIAVKTSSTKTYLTIRQWGN